MATPALAQPAQMVRDIATVPQELPPVLIEIPHRAVELGGVHYFFTSDGVHGRELWRTDGTAEGTWMVKDICPGQCHSGYGYDLERHDGILYFAGSDGVHGRELWRTDGTDAGTWMVKDINPGPRHGGIEWPTSALGSLYFAADDGVHGEELWKTDGSAAGTVMVADIHSTGDSEPNALVELGGWLLFSADDGTHGRELWRSDGEPGGTEMVLEIRAGTFPAIWTDQGIYEHQYSTILGGRLIFAADDGVHGSEIWATDGTSLGTEMVADIYPGSTGSNPFQLTPVGGLAFFAAETSSTDRELWKTDGTPMGTERVVDLLPGSGGSFPAALTAVGSRLFFKARPSAAVGWELCVSDGTAAGTRLVRDIRPGSESGVDFFILGLSAVGDRLFFGADDGVHGLEPWVSDGTESGTIPLADVNTGPLPAFSPFGLFFLATEIGSDAFFFAWDIERGWEPWISDGTPEGTRILRNLDDQVSSVPHTIILRRSELADVGGTLLFPAWAPGQGIELWRSDGTEAGTELVRNIDPTVYPPPIGAPFGADSWPQNLAVLGDLLLFSANDGEHGNELWSSDGTEAGTRIVEDIEPGPDSSGPWGLTPFSGAVYFSAGNSSSAAARRSSGIPGDVEKLYGGPGVRFTPAAGSLFFLRGRALYVSDGTAANTIELVPDGVTELAAAGAWLYFVRDGELWRTDGTAGETVQLSAFAPTPGVRRSGGSLDLPPLAGVPATGSVLFFADDGAHGLEPWWSDGTPEGTVRLADVRPGPESSWPRRPVTAGRTVFFWADDGTSGVEPWASDGTPEGTRRLLDLQPGPGSSFTSMWERATPALFSELFFPAYREGEGVELWRSDGTEAGTTLFQDVNPGAGSSSPDNMTLSGGRMFFTASDGSHGFELWAAPMAPPGIRLLLSATGGFFPGGTVVLTLILENTGDFALVDGPGDEVVFPLPPGLTLLSSVADRRGVTGMTARAGEIVVWNGGLPPRGVATLEVTARVGDLPVGTEIVAHAAARFDTTGDGVAEPEVPSDDPATAEDRDATRIVLGLAPPEIPVLSLPGLLALAGLLAGAAGRLLRRGQEVSPGTGSTPSSTCS